MFINSYLFECKYINFRLNLLHIYISIPIINQFGILNLGFILELCINDMLMNLISRKILIIKL